MAIIIFDPQTGTVLDAEGALLVDTDELETRLCDFTSSALPGEHIESVQQALVDEHPVAQELATEIGKPLSR